MQMEDVRREKVVRSRCQGKRERRKEELGTRNEK
jgi:hypothetical protein